MRIHCIRHEPFEGLAEIESWIKSNNHHLTYTRTYLHQRYPDEITFDMLIIMGGMASVYEKKDHPWIASEKKFIKKVLDSQKKIIAICFGAQILAEVLGAKVYPNKFKEIGWYPVHFNTNILYGFSAFPEQMHVFHWHGDTFDLPEGALRIASSEITKNQGFVVGNKIIALQFHLEMNQSALKKIVKALGNQLCINEKYIQPAQVIMNQPEYMTSCNKLLYQLLDRFTNNSAD